MENQEVTVLKWFLGTENSILFLIMLKFLISLFINAISMQIILVQNKLLKKYFAAQIWRPWSEIVKLASGFISGLHEILLLLLL